MTTHIIVLYLVTAIIFSFITIMFKGEVALWGLTNE